MKTIEIKEWKKQLANKWAKMTGNIENFNIPQLPRYVMV